MEGFKLSHGIMIPSFSNEPLAVTGPLFLYSSVRCFNTFDKPCGIASNNGIWGNIFGYNRTGTDNRILTDGHAR